MDRRYKKRIERYWTKMEEKAEVAFSNIDVNEWFDYWHTHPDWDGKGNSKPENRVRANQLTYSLLIKAEEMTKHRENEIQCWALIKNNTMDNSVYIHTENPNGTKFPFDYENVEWDVKNIEIEKIIDMKVYQIGLFEGDHENTYFIRKKA